jgi:hypothetical protein
LNVFAWWLLKGCVTDKISADGCAFEFWPWCFRSYGYGGGEEGDGGSRVDIELPKSQ